MPHDKSIGTTASFRRTTLAPAGLLILLLTAAAPAQTSSSDAANDRVARDAVTLLEGYASYKMGDYATARETWMRLAEAGNPNAMLNLSNLYEQGQGVPADLAEGARWMRRAAEAGYAPAQLNYGLMLERGRGVARDLAEARVWFEKAALQGDRDAAFNLGVLLLVLARDPAEADGAKEEARRWLQQAVDRGHGQAGAFLAQAAP